MDLAAQTEEHRDTMDEKHAETTSSMAPTDNGVVRPAGWMYHSVKIGGHALPWYASPLTQLLIVAFVCFLCPGMFNALNGLGGGGISNAHASNEANIALNSTFAIVAFFSGPICNRVGVRWTLALGGTGYCIYTAGLFNYKLNQNQGFVIFGGAFLGFCAGLLWTAQGTIMMSYPHEKNKGRYISIFWMIFNLGAVIGALIPLAQSAENKSNAVGNGTYIAFIVLMLCGSALACSLVNPINVVRSDGSRVITMKHPTWQSELLGMYQVLKTDIYIVALFPMFFASNWFYTYQFNAVNLAYFNIRTRSLNDVLYWSSQILGALVFGVTLDYPGLRRSLKARVGCAALFVLTMAIWGGGYCFQRQYTRQSVAAPSFIKKDWQDKGYIGPMFLMMFYGFFDAAWQTTVYWLMGCLSNNARKVSYFAGFYKGIQSAGAAIMPKIDADLTAYMAELASCWALLAGGLVVAAPVIWWKVTDHVDVEEDLKFSDELLEDVVPPGTANRDDHGRDVV